MVSFYVVPQLLSVHAVRHTLFFSDIIYRAGVRARKTIFLFLRHITAAFAMF